MPMAPYHDPFAPRSGHDTPRALTLALVAHALLVIALALGVQWKRDATLVTAEAELWSEIPQTAAPPAPEPEPQPPEPTPVEPEKVAPQPDPDIVTTRAKREAEREAQRLQEAAQREKDRQEAQRKTEQAAKDARKKEQEEARKLAELRQKTLDRLKSASGSSDNTASTGTAQRSSGPSASYAARIRALLRSNTRFFDSISDNPSTEVEIHVLPTGTILSHKITKPSGNPNWDRAVEQAIQNTARIPPDEKGRVPPLLIINHQPKD